MISKPRAKQLLKNFIGTAVFWIIFIILFMSMVGVFARQTRPSENGYEKRISYAYRGEPKNTVDVIVVGNSDAYRGFSPLDFYHETGITAAVSGEPKQTLAGSYRIVKDIFKYQKPKLVVIETDCVFNSCNDKKKHSSRRLLVRSHVKNKRDWKSWESALITGLNYEVPLMRHHKNWKKLKLSNLVKGKRSYYKYANKGMAYSSKVKKFDPSFDYMNFDPGKKGQMSKSDMMTMYDIAELCRKNGATPVFMTVPSANTWNNTKSISVQKVADKYGINYYDYNRLLPYGFDWSKHSKDGGNHLNYQGARVLSRDFALALKRDFKLKPTELTKKQRNQWEKDYRYFHSRIVQDLGGKK